jgi:hypothetical protein
VSGRPGTRRRGRQFGHRRRSAMPGVASRRAGHRCPDRNGPGIATGTCESRIQPGTDRWKTPGLPMKTTARAACTTR